MGQGQERYLTKKNEKNGISILKSLHAYFNVYLPPHPRFFFLSLPRFIFTWETNWLRRTAQVSQVNNKHSTDRLIVFGTLETTGFWVNGVLWQFKERRSSRLALEQTVEPGGGEEARSSHSWIWRGGWVCVRRFRSVRQAQTWFIEKLTLKRHPNCILLHILSGWFFFYENIFTPSLKSLTLWVLRLCTSPAHLHLHPPPSTHASC